MNTSHETWFGQYTPRRHGPPPQELAAMFENELTDIAKSRFPRAYEPMVVPTDSYHDLLWATEQLLELQRRAVVNLAPDYRGRLEAIKGDPADFPRFTEDNDFEVHHAIDMSRADVVVGVEGPKFVEFNVGAGVGAVLEFELERRIWKQLRDGAGKAPLTARSLYELIAALVTRTCHELSVEPSTLLVGSLLDPGKTTRYFDVQAKFLQEYGVSAKFVDLSALRDELDASQAKKMVGLMQFSEREANNCGWELSTLRSAMNGGLVGIPSQTARLIDSKKVLALLSEGLPWMTSDDHDLVRRFVPWSRVMGDRRVQWREDQYELPQLMLDQQEQFVLKGAAGYSSQEVFFGVSTPPREWATLVASAVDTEYYIAQEVIQPVRRPIQALMDESGRVETVMANPRISPFAAGGVATGCSMRFNPTDEIGPVTRPYGAWPGCLLGAPA